MIRPLPRNMGIAFWVAAYFVWRGGLDLVTLAMVIAWIAFGLAFYWVETRTKRPRRTYYFCGLGSVLFFLMLLAFAPSGASMLM